MASSPAVQPRRTPSYSPRTTPTSPSSRSSSSHSARTSTETNPHPVLFSHEDMPTLALTAITSPPPSDSNPLHTVIRRSTVRGLVRPQAVARVRRQLRLGSVFQEPTSTPLGISHSDDVQ